MRKRKLSDGIRFSKRLAIKSVEQLPFGNQKLFHLLRESLAESPSEVVSLCVEYGIIEYDVHGDGFVLETDLFNDKKQAISPDLSDEFAMVVDWWSAEGGLVQIYFWSLRDGKGPVRLPEIPLKSPECVLNVVLHRKWVLICYDAPISQMQIFALPDFTLVECFPFEFTGRPRIELLDCKIRVTQLTIDHKGYKEFIEMNLHGEISRHIPLCDYPVSFVNSEALVIYKRHALSNEIRLLTEQLDKIWMFSKEMTLISRLETLDFPYVAVYLSQNRKPRYCLQVWDVLQQKVLFNEPQTFPITQIRQVSDYFFVTATRNCLQFRGLHTGIVHTSLTFPSHIFSFVAEQGKMMIKFHDGLIQLWHSIVDCRCW